MASNRHSSAALTEQDQQLRCNASGDALGSDRRAPAPRSAAYASVARRHHRYGGMMEGIKCGAAAFAASELRPSRRLTQRFPARDEIADSTMTSTAGFTGTRPFSLHRRDALFFLALRAHL